MYISNVRKNLRDLLIWIMFWKVKKKLYIGQPASERCMLIIEVYGAVRPKDEKKIVTSRN